MLCNFPSLFYQKKETPTPNDFPRGALHHFHFVLPARTCQLVADTFLPSFQAIFIHIHSIFLVLLGPPPPSLSHLELFALMAMRTKGGKIAERATGKDEAGSRLPG